jgi:hypothetical protein
MRVEEEYCWAITQQRDGHAEADQVPVCWGLVFSWTQLFVLTRICLMIMFNHLGLPQN